MNLESIIYIVRNVGRVVGWLLTIAGIGLFYLGISQLLKTLLK